MNITNCPCQSGKPYIDCCQPFHNGDQLPATAEQLMRSRYTAYTLVNIDYIVATTLPTQQKYLDRTAMQEWGANTQWRGLEILAHHANISKIHSQVEFKAYFQTDTGIATHHELSLFVNIDKRWYFVDPTVPQPNQREYSEIRWKMENAQKAKTV